MGVQSHHLWSIATTDWRINMKLSQNTKAKHEKVVVGEGEVQDYIARLRSGLLNGNEMTELDLRKCSANLDPDADNRGADRD